ncbi:MAG TPA: class I SAM-dependent methyltransferase [Candidatus Sulfotelmatobacter sp.]|nr:class I SAM-dependent methyltransferase [Candidatus Sulfotelmatobacter sp.]
MDERHGARQPHRFDPRRSALLDDEARFAHVPPDELLALLELPADGLLLDFGTGTGTYALAIARARPDVRVLALDEQDAMLDQLRAKLAAAPLPNVEPIGPDALPALRGGVERILALNVLHELGDDALAHLRALLAPAGRAVIVDWNADVERPVGPPRDHVFGEREATDRLRASGFAVLATHPFAYHYGLTIRPAR